MEGGREGVWEKRKENEKGDGGIDSRRRGEGEGGERGGRVEREGGREGVKHEAFYMLISDKDLLL